MALFSLRALRTSFSAPQLQFRDEFHPGPFLQASPASQAGFQGVSCCVPSSSSPPRMPAALRLRRCARGAQCPRCCTARPGPAGHRHQRARSEDWNRVAALEQRGRCGAGAVPRPAAGAAGGGRVPREAAVDAPRGLRAPLPAGSAVTQPHPARIRTDPALSTTLL